MKLPNAENAVVTPEKLHDYLLNPEHPDGGPQGDPAVVDGAFQR